MCLMRNWASKSPFLSVVVYHRLLRALDMITRKVYNIDTIKKGENKMFECPYTDEKCGTHAQCGRCGCGEVTVRAPLTREHIAELLNKWIDMGHDFSEESMNDFCNVYADSYDEYTMLWYEAQGCIEEDV